MKECIIINSATLPNYTTLIDAVVVDNIHDQIYKTKTSINFEEDIIVSCRIRQIKIVIRNPNRIDIDFYRGRLLYVHEENIIEAGEFEGAYEIVLSSKNIR